MGKKYLPIHAKMIPLLAAGMLVVHNGNNGRQGKTGHIRLIAGHQVFINFDDFTSQKYSMDYFSRCFYISTTDIAEMHGNMFHADGFLHKYRQYAKTGEEMKSNQLSHERLKAKVELEVREAKLKVKHEPVTINAPAQDPLDKPGTFMLMAPNGVLLSDHRTMRLALAAAERRASDGKSSSYILQKVATITPKITVETDVQYA